ncbi:caspase family protein [Sediminicola luteus]|uniref:Caspase family p20 domain-containing protein n=1 Tax=Sediminicola luteus TaxID=319238 RepID=A0A2A4G7Q3_9FLAO|nr:caspase family protein [Sediminicola luteus]PCE64463.1 hypothetical protein B7P33_09255 [Sediminicola luteus]
MKRGPRKNVFVVGIDRYKNAGALHSAINDAQRWKGYFESRLEINPSRINCLTPTTGLEKEDFLKAFTLWMSEWEKMETAYIVFSGHGGLFQQSGEPVKMGVRCSDGVVFKSELDALILENWGQQRPTLVWVLDCCYAGAFGLGQELNNEILLASCTAEQKSSTRIHEGILYGAFTHTLLHLLDNVKGCTLDELQQALDEGFKNNRKQSPVCLGAADVKTIPLFI